MPSFTPSDPVVIDIFGLTVFFNLDMVIMTLFVVVVLILWVYLSLSKLKTVPDVKQGFWEIIFDFLRDLVTETLGEKNIKYLSWIGTLFIFIFFCNILGALPPLLKGLGVIIAGVQRLFFGGIEAKQLVGAALEEAHKNNFLVEYATDAYMLVPRTVWYATFMKFPTFTAPTQYLSTTLSMGILSFVIVQIAAIRANGFIGYLKTFAEPIFFLFPINIIGEMGKLISHSFRLFGNILGGSIIIGIVSGLLIKFISNDFGFGWFGSIIQIPALILLNGFFNIVIGLIQAFVFAMLAATYLAVVIVED
ncbi:MAG: F0F1 ATP synthase subunit A [Spirochaetes bacterium]|nr:F0F1 ATP synthase subunit A [Spirochaetota bacterium]